MKNQDYVAVDLNHYSEYKKLEPALNYVGTWQYMWKQYIKTHFWQIMDNLIHDRFIRFCRGGGESNPPNRIRYNKPWKQ